MSLEEMLLATEFVDKNGTDACVRVILWIQWFPRWTPMHGKLSLYVITNVFMCTAFTVHLIFYSDLFWGTHMWLLSGRSYISQSSAIDINIKVKAFRKACLIWRNPASYHFSCQCWKQWEERKGCWPQNGQLGRGVTAPVTSCSWNTLLTILYAFLPWMCSFCMDIRKNGCFSTLIF